MPDSFSFGNIKTSDYGIMAFPPTVIEGPERAYEYTPIPGRSGDLIIHDRRINNSIVNYGCIFCPNDNGMYGNYTSLEEAVTAFHSGLLSQAGYFDLSDTFNPAYFRKASFPGPLEITYSGDKRLAKCVVSFNCKPQRYLYSGEATYRFDQTGQFVRIQTLVGQSIQAYVPWLDRSVYTYFRWEAAANNGRPQSSPENVQEIRSLESVRIYENGVSAFFWFFGYTKYTKAVMYPLSGTGSGYAEEKSVPTTGWTLYGTNIFSHAFHGCSAANWCTHYPVYASAADLASVPYGIAIDGELGEETMYIKDSRYTTAEAFMANVPLANIKVDAQLSAPVAWEPTMPYYPYFPSSPGTAEISTDPGALLTMRYDAPPNRLANPTPFDSQPLIRVYGTGSVEINGITITVSAVGTSYTDIDCELMDCYEGSVNRNAYVSFSTYDFPVLVPGVTDVNVIDNTITAVEIKPRWWVV